MYCAIEKSSGSLELVTCNNNALLERTYSEVRVSNPFILNTSNLFDTAQYRIGYESINIDDHHDLYVDLMHSVFWNFENENPVYEHIEEDYYVSENSFDCKALKTDYAGATYKLYSQFDIRANIGNIPVLGQVVAQYELTIISCQSDNNSHVIKIYIVKNIAN